MRVYSCRVLPLIVPTSGGSNEHPSFFQNIIILPEFAVLRIPHRASTHDVFEQLSYFTQSDGNLPSIALRNACSQRSSETPATTFDIFTHRYFLGAAKNKTKIPAASRSTWDADGVRQIGGAGLAVWDKPECGPLFGSDGFAVALQKGSERMGRSKLGR